MDPAFCGGKEYTYLNRFCGPRPGFGGRMQYLGASNVQELHEKVRNWSIRKTKADVLKDLPDRVYTPVLLDCQVSESYREAETKILSMQGVNTGLLQERLSALTASAYDMKKDALIQWASEFLEDSEEKLVLFGWHTAALDHLEAHFGNACVRVSGGVSQRDKEAAVARFRKDALCRVFIGQIASAGVGIDGLQEVCSNVAFAEATWSWSLIDQATSRLHRMGQKNSVTVYYLMAPDTIDEVQVGVLEERRRMAASILDGKFNFEEDEEAAVIETIRKLKSPSR
jgi:SWI/SNF-related matrix-associated actin-dependent regulator of chromatin subfamily A-like protein 1